MKVSIVTLSFNQGKFLRRALRSVLEHKYPVEYIVVDPGSTDGSRKFISAYRNEIAHVVFQPDDGPAHGLNRGCAAASGDVLAYVNADDALLPGAVGEAVEYLAARPNSPSSTGMAIWSMLTVASFDLRVLAVQRPAIWLRTRDCAATSDIHKAPNIDQVGGSMQQTRYHGMERSV